MGLNMRKRTAVMTQYEDKISQAAMPLFLFADAEAASLASSTNHDVESLRRSLDSRCGFALSADGLTPCDLDELYFDEEKGGYKATGCKAVGLSLTCSVNKKGSISCKWLSIDFYNGGSAENPTVDDIAATFLIENDVEVHGTSGCDVTVAGDFEEMSQEQKEEILTHIIQAIRAFHDLIKSGEC
jgi:hypothetical protein